MLAAAISRPALAIEVVVNSSVKIAKIKERELRAIFALKRMRWPDSTPVTVVVIEGSNPLHGEFCKDVLHLFPHQLQTGWDRIVYSGRGSGPIVVKTEKEMLDILLRTPGSVGYLSNDSDLSELKILEID